MELGRLADGRPFVNVASAGLASAAARRAEPFKSFLGPLAYPVGALRAAMTEQPLRCTVCAGGEQVFDGEAWQAIVAVTGAFGGGADIDAADPEDGVLDAAILPAGSRLGLARRAWGLRRGTIAEQRDVRHARGTVVEVDLPPGTEFNVDGEVHDSGMERITVEHRAYELVVGCPSRTSHSKSAPADHRHASSSTLEIPGVFLQVCVLAWRRRRPVFRARHHEKDH